MEPQLIETIELENGLALEIRDASRKVAADRWLIKVVASMDVDVSDRWFSDTIASPGNTAEMQAKLGSTLRFEYRNERNFVDQNDKQTVFEAMLDSVMAKIAYYSHPNFAARFIQKEYTVRQALPPQA